MKNTRRNYTHRHISRAAVRHRQLLYRRMLISAIIITAIFTLVFSICTMSTRAASSVEKEKHYESVLLTERDTLTTLSSEYRDDEEQTYDEFVSDVCSANDLSDPDTIHEGCYLLIPVYSIRR